MIMNTSYMILFNDARTTCQHTLSNTNRDVVWASQYFDGHDAILGISQRYCCV